jgi:hypothetical protein
MASLREKTVFAGKGITVTAVESVELWSDRTNHRLLITGRLEPIAVIVRKADETCAFHLGGQPVDI